MRLTLDNGTINDTIDDMAKIEDILNEMMANQGNVRFADVCKICDHFFWRVSPEQNQP